MTISAEVDERTLHEVHLAPFEAAVREAGVWAVMTAYNKVNGVWCGEQPDLIGRVLRGKWGSDALVMSDWFGTHSTGDAAVAGLELEMPGPSAWLGPSLASAVRDGVVEEAVVDEKVRHLLGLMERVGILGAPASSAEAEAGRPGPAVGGPPGRRRGDGAAGQRRAAAAGRRGRVERGGDRAQRGATGHGRRQLRGDAAPAAQPGRGAGRAHARGGRAPRGGVPHRQGPAAHRPAPAGGRVVPGRVLRQPRTAGGRRGAGGGGAGPHGARDVDRAAPPGLGGRPVRGAGLRDVHPRRARGVAAGPRERRAVGAPPRRAGGGRQHRADAGHRVLRRRERAGRGRVRTLEAGRAYALSVEVWPRSDHSPILGARILADRPAGGRRVRTRRGGGRVERRGGGGGRVERPVGVRGARPARTCRCRGASASWSRPCWRRTRAPSWW